MVFRNQLSWLKLNSQVGKQSLGCHVKMTQPRVLTRSQQQPWQRGRAALYFVPRTSKQCYAVTRKTAKSCSRKQGFSSSVKTTSISGSNAKITLSWKSRRLEGGEGSIGFFQGGKSPRDCIFLSPANSVPRWVPEEFHHFLWKAVPKLRKKCASDFSLPQRLFFPLAFLPCSYY